MSDERHAGWYRDPQHPLRHRYWTGSRWQTQCERLDPHGADCD